MSFITSFLPKPKAFNIKKSEYEANQFMIKQMLADYLNELDISMNELNYVDFMEQYQLHDEELVLDCINHYGRDQ